MEELVKSVARLREKTRRYGNDVATLLDLPEAGDDPRSGCFGMVYNHLTLTLELLYYYHSIWIESRTVVTEQERDRIRQENGQRCLLVTKWLFVDSLSSMEYSAKASIRHYGSSSLPEKLLSSDGRYTYLSNIVANSRDDGLILDTEYKDWQNIIYLRNCVVHNNAVSDAVTTIEIGGAKLTAQAGRQFQGKLDAYVAVTEVAMDRYMAWVQALIKKYGK